MLSLPSFRRRSRLAAVMLLAALGTGCMRPLAVQHEFFSPASRNADRIGMQTQHAISHHRALQGARHACRPTDAVAASQGVTNVAHGPSSGFAANAGEALAELCASERRPAPAAYGATSNAYRRWVEDGVRKLPEAAKTAASAAGGS